jgi:hypothetical protein
MTSLWNKKTQRLISTPTYRNTFTYRRREQRIFVSVSFYLRLKIVRRFRTLSKGRAIAQAVSRRLLTAAARVRAQVWSCGSFGGQSDTGAGFLRVLRFPLPVLIPPSAPYSSSDAGTIGHLVADVPSGLSLTPPQGKKKTLSKTLPLVSNSCN